MNYNMVGEKAKRYFNGSKKRLRIAGVISFKNPRSVYIGDDVVIDSHCLLNPGGGRGKQIVIENRAILSWGSSLIASDLEYELPPEEREGSVAHRARPILIEEGVWVGSGSIVLGGVTVGKGAAVGAGSVVTKDVPPHTLACGNPAKVVKELERW